MTRPVHRERPQNDHDRDWVVTAFWVNARRAGAMLPARLAEELDYLLPRQLFQRYPNERRVDHVR